jgi:hypothetical protein
MMTINDCLEALERDCREPDKVLLNLSSLKRAVSEVRQKVLEGDDEGAYNLLYVRS